MGQETKHQDWLRLGGARQAAGPGEEAVNLSPARATQEAGRIAPYSYRAGQGCATGRLAEQGLLFLSCGRPIYLISLGKDFFLGTERYIVAINRRVNPLWATTDGPRIEGANGNRQAR